MKRNQFLYPIAVSVFLSTCSFSLRAEAAIAGYLYEHSNFRGRRITVQTSTNRQSISYSWRRKISSVRVNPGHVFTLHLKHGSYRIIHKNTNLPKRTNDYFVAVSNGVPMGSDHAKLYAHHFSGNRLTLSHSKRYIPIFPTSSNDNMSSICVRRGQLLTIYEHNYYQGRSRRISGTCVKLNGFWNDRISSCHLGTVKPPPTFRFFRSRGFRGHLLTKYTLTRGWGGDLISKYNDKISSVIVAPGKAITVYRHSRFRGASRVLRGRVNLSGIWNNSISSYKIGVYPNKPIAIVYKHYSGGPLGVIYNGGGATLTSKWNDQISSIKVLRGSIRVYEHAYYRGRSRRLGVGMHRLRGFWNDRISSIR